MDKDMNGTVSKGEFLQFMGQMFDRFDVNRSNQLEPTELRNVAFGADKRTVAEARRLLRGGQRHERHSVKRRIPAIHGADVRSSRYQSQRRA
jgi:hypothetical protein